jgi:hypothetical protein
MGVFFFFVDKRTQSKDIHKEIVPVYDGKCLSRKAVHNLVEKFSQERSKIADDSLLSRPVEIAREANISVLRVSTHW